MIYSPLTIGHPLFPWLITNLAAQEGMGRLWGKAAQHSWEEKLLLPVEWS